MNQLIVKQATLSEIEEVVPLFDLYRQFYGKESNKPKVRDFLLNRFNHGESIIFIAYLAGEPVGFTQLYPSFSSSSLARIFILNDLYVISSARKNGVATALIENAKIFSRTLSAVRLTLSTAVTNTAAQRLYESLGWQKDEQFYAYNFQI
jgi:ribosomal protein S18 acetylase RimI-like enzyme